MGILLAGKYNFTCKFFAEYIDDGAKRDDFEGFKILYRLYDLHNGTSVFIAEAEDMIKIFDQIAPFIKWENAR